MVINKYMYIDRKTGEVYESEDRDVLIDVICELSDITIGWTQDEKTLERQEEIRAILAEKYLEEIEIITDEPQSEYEEAFNHYFDEGLEAYRNLDI